ncbi:hypothetical protein AC17_5091 [Escherichia coli 2-210-07_S3_C2]|nr:hypothetical protein AC17_5368 [Escherichia coli 2-210-07_S3_C2]KDW92709.1 hypothetical protein AC17_5091 [Escherichia coli 2-210-07_S3_C2]
MVTLKAHILPPPDLQPPGCRGSKMLINNIKDKSYKIFHNNDTVFILCNNCQ